MESRYCQKPINLKVLVETDFSIIELQNYMFSLETIWLTFGKLWSSCLRKASVLASEFSDSRLRVFRFSLASFPILDSEFSNSR